MNRIAAVSLLTSLALALPGSALAEASPSPDTVTVAGTGIVRATPDRASINAGVETKGDTAAQALARNATLMKRVIAALRRAGGKDVTTAWVSLSPRILPDGTQSGFLAMNMASASFRLANAGPALDAATRAGANTVSGPSFVFSQREALYLRALDAAMANARSRALRLAQAAGRTLGRAVTISESSYSPGPIPIYAKGAADAVSTPIVAGEQDMTASVTVTFALR
ncbi:MAG: DUF541 domain-containing protein [Thermoleophilia bacterium]|nr:DUF541 domain-containing protein [Thermoleophilia bacterium]